MPPKGYKKPPAATDAARCPACGKITPEAMLRGFVVQLQRLRDDLAVEWPRTDETALRRAAQLAVTHARSTAELLLDDAAHLLCAGHEKKKPGRKPKTETVDPSDPRAPEEKTTRKKRSPAALRAVSDGDR